MIDKDFRKVLIYFALKYKGDWDKIYEAIKTFEHVDLEKVNEEVDKLPFNVLTIVDDNYPLIFKKIYKPPYVLFYYGDISLLNKDNIIGVIGSRQVSDYSLEICKEILYGLDDAKPIIISGLALGVDTCAHECALEYDYPTIAVLGTGIDYCYPKENYKLYDSIKYKGLLISEYPYKEKVDKDSFTMRNRIVAALSNIIFIPEIKERSGTAVTLRIALNLGKEILVIPHPLNDGTINNILIQEGAKMTLTTEDILEELKY